jgi:hypothetical protein
VVGFWIFTFEKRLPSRTIGEELRPKLAKKSSVVARFFSRRARALNVSLVALTLFSPRFPKIQFVSLRS